MTATFSAVIDLDVAGPTISRHLYGHFAEHLGRCIYDGFWVGEDADVPHEGGIRADVVEALRAIAIPNLRWPGGCFADEYHWMDGIGPREDRPRMVNTHWGDVEENNHFGTHEFMALCELLDTEPYISANVGSGSVRETSEWVEYLNRSGDSPMARLRAQNGHPEPWKVRLFGIGNEPWGCGGNLRAEQFAPMARQHATYARDHGENRLYRIAAGASDADYAWTETLMKQVSHGLGDTSPRETFQAISFHYYTMSGAWSDKGSATEFSREEYWTTMRRAQHVRELIAGHAAVMDAYDPTKKIGLALDEWGTWWNVEPGTNPGFLYQQNTQRDALVAAVHFDAFHAHADRLRLANIAQTVNVLQAMVLTDGHQMILTPTYHAFAMATGHHDAQSLAVHRTGTGVQREVDGTTVDAVSVTASTKDGRATITAANLDPDAAVRIELSLRGANTGTVTGRILVAGDVADHNTASEPNRVAPQDYDGARIDGGTLSFDLPAAALVTLELEVS
ncbi:alpha-N-arabinofuranosidase [Bogoriella caseilytica]|uniref:non-reducing end alpha-L-arabinofuranosidase n=1 Tax=Bogoriella caseilytica TaxID=56055 RepID=A0A3N2BFT5_9MICO|nr:alpha-L-arabinofuranosidase C-terminal domain-containing protein [Bogoriella caseilytica]ROR74078.1 alpha-N-arabinofuranosidase [Bogoriella caseilytica]